MKSMKGKEREEERMKEREEWEEKRMKDPNLVIPQAANLPSLKDVVGDLESQPTPDITSELMQVVRTIEKIATTVKNLKGQYVRELRSATLQIHAGLNVLAHRAQAERNGDGEEVTNLRRKVRSLKLEKERMERELKEAALTRKEMDRLQKENGDLRNKLRGLKDELLEVMGRFIAGMDGGDRPAGEGGRTLSSSRSPPPLLHLFPPAGEVGCGRPLLKAGTVPCLPFPRRGCE